MPLAHGLEGKGHIHLWYALGDSIRKEVDQHQRQILSLGWHPDKYLEQGLLRGFFLQALKMNWQVIAIFFD